MESLVVRVSMKLVEQLLYHQIRHAALETHRTDVIRWSGNVCYEVSSVGVLEGCEPFLHYT